MYRCEDVTSHQSLSKLKARCTFQTCRSGYSITPVPDVQHPLGGFLCLGQDNVLAFLCSLGDLTTDNRIPFACAPLNIPEPRTSASSTVQSHQSLRGSQPAVEASCSRCPHMMLLLGFRVRVFVRLFCCLHDLSAIAFVLCVSRPRCPRPALSFGHTSGRRELTEEEADKVRELSGIVRDMGSDVSLLIYYFVFCTSMRGLSGAGRVLCREWRSTFDVL